MLFSIRNTQSNLTNQNLNHMKNPSITFIQKVSLAAFSLLLSFGAFAQDDKVSITTVYDDPMKNTWNGGIFAGLDVQNGSGGLFLGVNGRYTLGKIATFSTNLAVDMTNYVKSGGILKYDEAIYAKMPSYKNFEFRGVFHLKDEIRDLSSKIKLGQSGDMKYSTSYTTKSRYIFGLTASLNIQSRIATQNLDSTASNFAAIYTLRDANNADPGYVKDVFAGQTNVLIGAGIHLGQYTWFKGKFTAAPIGTKTRRVRKSIVTNFEVLYGLAIRETDEAYKTDANGNLLTYKLTDTEKRRLGFRISADYSSNKPGLFNRFEIGYRPGIFAPNKQSKYLNQAYIVYGLGLAF